MTKETLYKEQHLVWDVVQSIIMAASRQTMMLEELRILHIFTKRNRRLLPRVLARGSQSSPPQCHTSSNKPACSLTRPYFLTMPFPRPNIFKPPHIHFSSSFIHFPHLIPIQISNYEEERVCLYIPWHSYFKGSAHGLSEWAEGKDFEMKREWLIDAMHSWLWVGSSKYIEEKMESRPMEIAPHWN